MYTNVYNYAHKEGDFVKKEFGERPHRGPHSGEEGRRDGRRGRGGAQTFRRGRVLEFYQQLITKRDTLKRQLESTELKSIQPVIGELKAIETVMDEFKVAFCLEEVVEEQQERVEEE